MSLETDQAISGKGDAATNPDYVEMMRNLGSFVDWGQGYANLNSEEWVTVCETWRMLGMVDTIEEAREQYDRVRKGEPASVTPIYAVTRRTSRDVGHILRLELTFEHAVNLGKIRQTASEYKLTGKAAAIPSSPERLFVDADGMPDPEKHSFTGMGMSYVVGGWKQEAPNLITVYALVNNLYGGAAGNAIQNAELWLEANHDAFTRPIA